MQKSIMLLMRTSATALLLSLIFICISAFDVNHLFSMAVIHESEQQLYYYDKDLMLATYKSVGAFVDTHSLDKYLGYVNLDALDDLIIVRFLMPFYYLKLQLLGFFIFCMSSLGYYKKTYELKHIAEQKMRIARMHGPLISLIFFILCIQPLICHALLGISLILFAIYIIVNKYYYLMGLSSDA